MMVGRPFSFRFVLRTLARMMAMANQVTAEEFAAGLCELGVPRETPWFLSTYLDEVKHYMPEDPVPTCPECGRDWDHARRDRRYCSPKCRQRAHRKRVADSKPPQQGSRNKGEVRDASLVPQQGKASPAFEAAP
jgi:hypothetical protein